MRRTSIQLWFCSLALLPLGSALLGCGQGEGVRHYQAVRLKQPEVPAVDGILAAVVLPDAAKTEETAGDASDNAQPAMAWFFKLAGPVEAVHAQAEAFHSFLKSVHFTDGRPQYDPPAEWQAQGPSAMRFDTFQIPGEKPLELAITTLPRGDEDETTFLLANINRWRGQLSLGKIDAPQLADGTAQLKLADSTATVVSLVGKLKAGGMSAPFAPFAGGGGAQPKDHGTTESGSNSGSSNPGESDGK